MQYAGVWRRLLAYTVDMIPIFGVVFCVAYFFLGFDRTLSDYFDGDGSYEARAYFLAERNKVRDSALLLWVLYGLIMDCSKYQGTHGKILLNLKVVDETGGRIGFAQSAKRASMKVVGAIPIFLGYIWAAFRKDKAAWHDLVAKTRVISADERTQRDPHSASA